MLPVQAEGQRRSGGIWTCVGDGSNPSLVYNSTPDRTWAGPLRFLSA